MVLTDEGDSLREARPHLVGQAHVDDSKVAGEAVDDPPGWRRVVVAEGSVSDARQRANEERSSGLERASVSCENAQDNDHDVSETFGCESLAAGARNERGKGTDK